MPLEPNPLVRVNPQEEFQDRWFDLQELPEEEWRNVWAPDYSDYYEVSSLGRVRTIERVVPFGTRQRTVRPRILRPYQHSNGLHLAVRLSAESQMKAFFVHALVAETFLGERPRGKEVAHCNGNPRDNRLENLRWATRSENHQDKWIHGTMPVGEKNSRASLTDAQAREVIRLKQLTGAANRELAERFGVSATTVSRICCGKRYAHLQRAA